MKTIKPPTLLEIPNLLMDKGVSEPVIVGFDGKATGVIMTQPDSVHTLTIKGGNWVITELPQGTEGVVLDKLSRRDSTPETVIAWVLDYVYPDNIHAVAAEIALTLSRRGLGTEVNPIDAATRWGTPHGQISLAVTSHSGDPFTLTLRRG